MSDAHLANVESFLFRGHQRRAVAAGHAGTNSCHGHPAARVELILPASRQSPNRWAEFVHLVASGDVTVADI